PAAARAALAAELRARAFTPAAAAPGAPRIGAEAELIALDAATGGPCALHRTLLPFLRRHGAREGWRERRSAKGTPLFALPDGGTISFEPGGQLEYGTPPCASASALLARLRAVLAPLVRAAGDAGIALLAVGIDPVNPVRDAPLQLHAERYVKMARYLATIGEAGARMMRQTAALQVSLDLGAEPERRWRVLNAMAPYLTAIFANSAIHAGLPTGCASWRAHGWRLLDPTRTGIPPHGGDPVEGYLDFALGARAMMCPGPDGAYEPFGALLARGDASPAEWEEHLTTLFPEVRPRGWLEVRSCDAVPLEWQAAPIALLVGIACEPRALREAEALLGEPDEALLERAGRCGVHDPVLARRACDLAEIALAGCAALHGYISPADAERARAFFDAYTRRGRTLADDALEAHGAREGRRIAAGA
ncbi:MAG TPA: glutamate-cysteine ligase family protein, partial [Gemmatimonadaceae bacterium]|nr:glutamate-cysteine ligase family protein [Gemmatimonadaceae bacterium]